MFYRIFRENIAQGIERRHKMGNPVLEPEILSLDKTLRALDVNLTKEFNDLNLPKERPKIVPPPTNFQKMVDELGLHPVLQPDYGKLFKTATSMNPFARRSKNMKSMCSKNRDSTKSVWT